jgi:hypothetical protein
MLQVASKRKKVREQRYKLQTSVKRPASNLNAWEKTMEHKIDRRSIKSIAKFANGSKSIAKFAIGRRQWSMNSIAKFAIGSNF